MTYGYYEYRLREVNMMLSIIGEKETTQKKELLKERNTILEQLKQSENIIS